MMSVIRLPVYDGRGRPVGDIHVSIESVHAWLAARKDADPQALTDVRDLVDPAHENVGYDWDLWARPGEVAEAVDSS